MSKPKPADPSALEPLLDTELSAANGGDPGAAGAEADADEAVFIECRSVLTGTTCWIRDIHVDEAVRRGQVEIVESQADHEASQAVDPA
jgi:hypothetical protein